MTDQSDRKDTQQGVEERLAYEPPRVCESASFETLALSCLQGADGSCGFDDNFFFGPS